MKIQPGWRFHLLTAVFCSLCLAPLARGQGAGLTFTVASESVTAGAAVSVWLNVLNPSGQEISWTFPPQIERKIISAQGSFTGELELHSTELSEVTIAPGAFVRREYIATMPAAVAGRAVLGISRAERQPRGAGCGGANFSRDGAGENGGFICHPLF